MHKVIYLFLMPGKFNETTELYGMYLKISDIQHIQYLKLIIIVYIVSRQSHYILSRHSQSVIQFICTSYQQLMWKVKFNTEIYIYMNQITSIHPVYHVSCVATAKKYSL